MMGDRWDVVRDGVVLQRDLSEEYAARMASEVNGVVRVHVPLVWPRAVACSADVREACLDELRRVERPIRKIGHWSLRFLPTTHLLDTRLDASARIQGALYAEDLIKRGFAKSDRDILDRAPDDLDTEVAREMVGDTVPLAVVQQYAELWLWTAWDQWPALCRRHAKRKRARSKKRKLKKLANQVAKALRAEVARPTKPERS